MTNDQTISGRVLLPPTPHGMALVRGAERIAVRWATPPDPLPEPGDLVALTGAHADGAFEAREATIVSPYDGPRPFPQPGSDWYRMHRNGAALYRSVELRARLLRSLRAWFDARGFLEVDTPALATSPGLEVHLDAVPATPRLGFGAPPSERWLVTSPEYHMKRLLSAGFERIYQIGKAFRSGEVGRLHNVEFTMLEWYRAPGTWQDVVADTEQLVVAAAEALGVGLQVRYAGHVVDLTPPWDHMTVREAITRFAGFDPWPWTDVPALRAKAVASGLDAVADEDDPAEILVRTLVERVELSLPGHRPVVLTHWPACMASLARRVPGDPDVSERFEVYLGGMELANGFGELTDAAEQRGRLEADRDERARRGLPQYPVDERFLAALAIGFPPAGGNALGVDRLLMFLSGATDVSHVVSFMAPDA